MILFIRVVGIVVLLIFSGLCLLGTIRNIFKIRHNIRCRYKWWDMSSTRILICWSCGKRHAVSWLTKEFGCTCGNRFRLVKFVNPLRPARYVTYQEDITK